MLDDPEKAKAALARLEAIKAQRAAKNKLANFIAYKKQREFFAAGKKHRERLLMAANRFGKTECGAAEMSYHLTGQYPPDWRGKRFDKPVRAWGRLAATWLRPRLKRRRQYQLCSSAARTPFNSGLLQALPGPPVTPRG